MATETGPIATEEEAERFLDAQLWAFVERTYAASHWDGQREERTQAEWGSYAESFHSLTDRFNCAVEILLGYFCNEVEHGGKALDYDRQGPFAAAEVHADGMLRARVAGDVLIIAAALEKQEQGNLVEAIEHMRPMYASNTRERNATPKQPIDEDAAKD